MIGKISAEISRWRMLPVSAALLFGVWGADSTFAAPVPDSLGTLQGTSLSIQSTADPTTASTNPGSPNGGPFLLALSAPNPGDLLSSRGIPSSVMSWCVETDQFISLNVVNTGVQLYSQAASKIGALV